MPGYADPGFDTLALHAGATPDPTTGAAGRPLRGGSGLGRAGAGGGGFSRALCLCVGGRLG